MERLVVNLIENAVRHGGGDVEVRTSAVGGQVMLSVLDRGPGIPPADAERLLKPFTRLDIARGTPGAGLGLAIVDRVARMHGGTVELMQRPGGGTEVRIPLALAVPDPTVTPGGESQARL
jgi:two-component system osmolarity sensor histidine kinase EnvZ